RSCWSCTSRSRWSSRCSCACSSAASRPASAAAGSARGGNDACCLPSADPCPGIPAPWAPPAKGGGPLMLWDWEYTWEILPVLLDAAIVTIEATVIGFVLAAVLGLVL